MATLFALNYYQTSRNYRISSWTTSVDCLTTSGIICNIYKKILFNKLIGIILICIVDEETSICGIINRLNLSAILVEIDENNIHRYNSLTFKWIGKKSSTKMIYNCNVNFVVDMVFFWKIRFINSRIWKLIINLFYESFSCILWELLDYV